MSETAITRTFGAVPAAAPMATGAAASRAAIARAAEATGVDFGYLLAQAKLESGLDPQARARTSSATGLYQFLGGTWLDTLRKHGAEHGLDWAAQAASDPALRRQVMALRRDPEVSALMAAELANDNRAALSAALGRDPDPAELYLAHFLGSQGATRFLTGLSSDPSASAAGIVPGAAAANRAVFYGAGGRPRTLGEVMDLVRTRLNGAMENQDADLWADAASLAGTAPVPAGPVRFAGGPVARAFQAAAADAVPALPSMAETLRQTFNVGGSQGSGGEGPNAPDHVRYTYRRLSALGL